MEQLSLSWKFPAERKVNRTADLDAALAFVIGRIEEEATRSDEPLSDGQRFLLNHLPKVSALPQADGADPESPMLLLPRDIEYERLCGLAKAAHRNDLRLNPALVIDWDFAAAVSKLNGHPMSWLLQWAGVKVRRPLWDRWLLIAAALLLISSVATAAALAGTEPWTPFRWRVSVLFTALSCFSCIMLRGGSKNGSCSGTLRDAVATPALPPSHKCWRKSPDVTH